MILWGKHEYFVTNFTSVIFLIYIRFVKQQVLYRHQKKSQTKKATSSIWKMTKSFIFEIERKRLQPIVFTSKHEID